MVPIRQTWPVSGRWITQKQKSFLSQFIFYTHAYMSSLIQWTRKGTQCMFLQWEHFLQHSGWFRISLIVIYSMLNGWPWLNLGLLGDYGQKEMWDSQVNLASDWAWGRSIRITSQVIVFCVLDMNNFYRRIKKSYKLTGLCAFSPREWCWRILCTFVLFDIFAKSMC